MPTEANPSLHQLVASAKSTLLKKLRSYGIYAQITCKIKPLKQTNWLALYRSGTQFRSRPIFWINANFLDQLAGEDPGWAMRTTLNHEYGHVIHEWAVTRGGFASGSEPAKTALQLIDEIGDPEEFCERFGRWLDNSPPQTSRFNASTGGNVRAAKASALSIIEMREAVTA